MAKDRALGKAGEKIKERRAWPRYDLTEAFVYPVDIKSGKSLSCRILNISLGGACLELPAAAEALPVSTRLRHPEIR